MRNIVNEAVKKITINFSYSYLVIAKPTMLNNEYIMIKKPYLKTLKECENEYFLVDNNKIY